MKELRMVNGDVAAGGRGMKMTPARYWTPSIAPILPNLRMPFRRGLVGFAARRVQRYRAAATRMLKLGGVNGGQGA